MLPSRCFYLSRKVEEYASRNPVEREECKEIIQRFKDMSFELLDQCNNTDEVQIILEDHTGTSKFFSYAQNMVLPTLQMAIEHNHKEFVGHSLCQQVFRHFYHQSIPWHGKSLRLRFLHLFLQVLLAPISVAMSLFVWIGKDVSSKCGIDEKELSLYGFRRSTDEDASLIRKFFNKTLDQLTHKQLSLNVPLNRFLIFTGYYFIFVVLIVGAILEKAIDESVLCFGNFHRFLTLYVISMLWADLNSLRNARSITTFFKFWRVYDLVLHVMLAFALIFRSIRVLDPAAVDCSCSVESCNRTSNNNSIVTKSIDLSTATSVPPSPGPSPIPLIPEPMHPLEGPWKHLYEVEDMFFAFVATMAFAR